MAVVDASSKKDRNDVQALYALVRPAWAPLRHVERGWNALTAEEQADVESRVERVLAKHKWGDHKKDALLHLFTFLAQVETIAIEIPLRFLPHARAEVRPLLRRQLVDEVFHSIIFARLAHDLAGAGAAPPPPLASAERLLQRIRDEDDLAITATMLNLVAEGWIETLFKHALKWNVADAVFQQVLREEARHVEEAHVYMQGLDVEAAQAAVETFEQGMAEVGAEPTVALSILDIAGPEGQAFLARDLMRQHERTLKEAGLQPSARWRQAAEAAANANLQAGGLPMPTPVSDSDWRHLARQVWLTPRDPTMQGDFDVPVGHIHRKELTPIIIAAFGRALARNPELNRVLVRDQVWQLPLANVGVRVLLEDDELATVVIPEADRRSLSDIRRMLADGIEQLRAQRKAGAKAVELRPDIAALMPALPHMYAIGFSNAGKWGVVSGAGSFSGWISPSSDFTVGVRRRLPKWRGIAYVPHWHVNFGGIQDHRVLDGRQSAIMVRAVQEAMSPAAVKEIRARADSLPKPEDIPETEGQYGRAVEAFQTQAAALGLMGLPKYTPVVLGGLGIGAVVGFGGYLMYQGFQNVPAAIPTPPAPAKAAPVRPAAAPAPSRATQRPRPTSPKVAAPAVIATGMTADALRRSLDKLPTGRKPLSPSSAKRTAKKPSAPAPDGRAPASKSRKPTGSDAPKPAKSSKSAASGTSHAKPRAPKGGR